MTVFIRFQATTPNTRGHHPGVFALANGLAADGLLSADDERWRQKANADMTARYVDPSTVDPGVYDRQRHPGAAAWFRADATELIERVGAYCDLLDRYGVAWERVERTDPGRVVYSDAVQVVAVPHGSGES